MISPGWDKAVITLLLSVLLEVIIITDWGGMKTLALPLSKDQGKKNQKRNFKNQMAILVLSRIVWYCIGKCKMRKLFETSEFTVIVGKLKQI